MSSLSPLAETLADENWLSFPSPSVDMLIPQSVELRRLVAELEDLLGGQHSLPEGGQHSLPEVTDFSVYDAVEFSSMKDVPVSVGFAELDDSLSVTENHFLCLGGHSADSPVALSHPKQQPATVDSPTLPVGSMVSCQRKSIYRGVTRHKRTGRFEAHFWDNTWRCEGQKRKGRQVYLGGYDKEEKAARAYDLGALKYGGLTAKTNFPVKIYHREMEEMNNMTKTEFIASIRRQSNGFSRGTSIYRGVTRQPQHGRWQARIGRVTDNKFLYLGTFATEEEAAEAYDIAAIKFKNLNAVTNFEFSRYNLEAIANSELPIGAAAKKLKQTPQPCYRTQLAIRNSTALLPSSSSEGLSAILRNVLLLQPSYNQTAPLQNHGLVGSEYEYNRTAPLQSMPPESLLVKS